MYCFWYPEASELPLKVPTGPRANCCTEPYTVCPSMTRVVPFCRKLPVAGSVIPVSTFPDEST